MSKEEREGLIKFCVMARADLEGIDIIDIEVNDFAKLSDEELLREADWLDEVLGK